MKSKLYVHILIDASGSMLPNKGPTLTACNQYVDSLDNDAVVSLSTFSTTGGVRHVHTNVDPGRAKMMPEDYECVGGTPLYDAIGQTIQEIDTAAKEFDRIVLVIQTDGAETSSREFNKAAIRQLLQDKQDGEGWLVVFLGANLEAAAQAEGMGIVAANSMQYAASTSARTFGAVARSTQSYLSAGSRAEGRTKAAFTTDERTRSQ